jgi:hypothetical protein
MWGEQSEYPDCGLMEGNMRDAKEIASELETLLVRLAELDTQIEDSSAEVLAAQEPDSKIRLHKGMQAALDRQKALLQRIKTVSKEYIKNISRTF